ncbi:MAG: malonic semialdehyde reductase [Acetobacteraceae bacterium]|nr:malonic semialdehyde reductase [Acetobacteraceae bacterium]
MPSDVTKPPEAALNEPTPPEPKPAGGVEGAAAVTETAAVPPEAEREPTPEPAPRAGTPLDDSALDQLFRAAHTQYGFTGAAVSDDDLRAIFELMKWCPTSANTSPARFLFLRTQTAKDRLRPALSAGNLAKTMLAPVTVIVAYDPKFYDYLPRLFPHTDAKPWFTSNPALAEETAFRNGTLQGAYFMLAARALGFGLGPMSGFDNAKVDAEFLSDRGWKSNFLVNLGHGDPAAERPRGPRFWFDETCLLL